jgi:hypothetical protein
MSKIEFLTYPALFKWTELGNSIDESCLPYTCRHQRYFQTKYHYCPISFCPIPSRSVPFIFSRMTISLMPGLYTACIGLLWLNHKVAQSRRYFKKWPSKWVRTVWPRSAEAAARPGSGCKPPELRRRLERRLPAQSATPESVPPPDQTTDPVWELAKR